MTTHDILNAIDEQISKLQQARTILGGADSGSSTNAQPAKRRGRPKGSGLKSVAKVAAAVPAKFTKRKATPVAERAASKPAKPVTKIVAKRPAKSPVKKSSAKKSSFVKKADAPQTEVASTSV